MTNFSRKNEEFLTADIGNNVIKSVQRNNNIFKNLSEKLIIIIWNNIFLVIHQLREFLFDDYFRIFFFALKTTVTTIGLFRLIYSAKILQVFIKCDILGVLIILSHSYRCLEFTIYAQLYRWL